MIAPPWAADAAGRRVPTTFEFEDGRLTQSVETQAADYVFPIVADPYMGKYLFRDLNTRRTWNGKPVYSGTKTDWGQKIHNGQAGDPAGWIGGVIVGQAIMRNEGWREWTSKWGSKVTSRATFYQQYSCHVAGGFYDWAGEWNLEAARTNNATWIVGVAFHRCNW